MNTDTSLDSDEEEVIPLSTPPPVRPPPAPEIIAAAQQDFSAWESAYKRLMAKTIGYAHWLLTNKNWSLLGDDHFRLFEMEIPSNNIEFVTKPNYTYHAVKVSGIMNVRAERVMYVIKDHDPDTRLTWDGEDMVSIQEMQTFKTDGGDIKVVQSEVRSPFPLIGNRIALGIQWVGYTAATRTHKLVFRTTTHWLYRVPPEQVALDGMVCVVVRALDTPNECPSCEVTLVSYMSLGGTVPSILVNLLKERLRLRFALYERVAKKWDQYYGPERDPKLLKNRK